MTVAAVFFDLDDTLHDFSSAQEAAMRQVYDRIGREYCISEQSLRDTFQGVLERRVRTGFGAGKTSTEYRTEGFAQLLEAYGVRNDILVGELLNLYGTTLESHMRPYPGAEAVLARLPFPLYIVTEGPMDAQQRALDILGLRRYFRAAFISGEVGLIKKTGELYTYAAQQSGYDPSTILSVGDSYERDMVGSMTAGLTAVWLNRKNKILTLEQTRPHAEIFSLDQVLGVVQRLS